MLRILELEPGYKPKKNNNGFEFSEETKQKYIDYEIGTRSTQEIMEEVQKYGFILTKEERAMNLTPEEIEIKRQKEYEKEFMGMDEEVNQEVEEELRRLKEEKMQGDIHDYSIRVEPDSPFYGEEDMIFEGATKYTSEGSTSYKNTQNNNQSGQYNQASLPIPYSNPTIPKHAPNPYLQSIEDNITNYSGLPSNNPALSETSSGRKPYMVQGIDIRTIPRMYFNGIETNPPSSTNPYLQGIDTNNIPHYNRTSSNPATSNAQRLPNIPTIQAKKINYDGKYIYCDNSLKLYQDDSSTAKMNIEYERKLQNIEAKSLLETLDNGEVKTEERKEDNMNFNETDTQSILEQAKRERDRLLAKEKSYILEQEKTEMMKDQQTLKEKEEAESYEIYKAKVIAELEEKKKAYLEEQKRKEAEKEKQEKLKHRSPIVYVDDKGAIIENTEDDSDMINLLDLLTENIKISDNNESAINISSEHTNPNKDYSYNNQFNSNNNQSINSYYNQNNNYYNQNVDMNYYNNPNIDNYYNQNSNDSLSDIMRFINEQDSNYEYHNNHYNSNYNGYNNRYINNNQELATINEIQQLKEELAMMKEIQALKAELEMLRQEQSVQTETAATFVKEVINNTEVYIPTENIESDVNEPYVISGVTVEERKEEDYAPLEIRYPNRDEAVYVDDKGQITEKPKLIKYYKYRGVDIKVEGEIDEDYFDRTNLFIEAGVLKPDGTRYTQADYDKIPYYANRRNYRNPDVFYVDKPIEIDDTPLKVGKPVYKDKEDGYNDMIRTITNNSWKNELNQLHKGLIKITPGTTYNIDENGQIPYCEFPTYAKDEKGRVVAFVVRNGEKVFLENNDPFEFSRDLCFEDGTRLADEPFYDLPISKGLDSDEVYTDDVYYERYQKKLQFKANLPVDNNKVGDIDYSRLTPEVAEILRQRERSYEFQEKKKQLEIRRHLVKCVNKILKKDMTDEEVDRIYSVENLIRQEQERIEDENLARLQRYAMGIGVIDKQKYDALVWEINFLTRRLKAIEILPPDMTAEEFAIKAGWLYLDMLIRKAKKEQKAERDLTALYDRDSYLRLVHQGKEVQTESFIIPNTYTLTEDELRIYADTAKRMKDQRLYKRTQFLQAIMDTKKKRKRNNK